MCRCNSPTDWLGEQSGEWKRAVVGQTWGEPDGMRKGGCGEKGEGGAEGGGAENLGRVAHHEAALAVNSEAEGQNDDAQEAHQHIAAAHGQSGALQRDFINIQFGCVITYPA